jgi:TonB family protein
VRILGVVLSFAGVVGVALPVLAAATQAAAPAKAGVPACDDPSLTRPVNESVISIKDSYPPLSTVLGEEGNVLVSFIVNPNGTVSDVTLGQSSGLARLDEATVNAAKQSLYTPAKLAGSPVACRQKLRVLWRVSNDTPKEVAQRATFNFVVPPKSAWPADALARGSEGATGVGVLMDSAGKIMTTETVRSSGIPDLDDAALAYVRALKLKPAEVEGKPASTPIFLMVIWSKQPPTLPHPAVVSQ